LQSEWTSKEKNEGKGRQENLSITLRLPGSAGILPAFPFESCIGRQDAAAPRAGQLRGCLDAISGYGDPMSKVTKLLHTRYRVNDLERTVKFYKEVLGLTETRRHKSPRGSELVFLKAPESEELIELCHYPASGPVQVQADLTHLAFEVDSLEAFGRHLAILGIQYSDGPHLKPDGGGIAFVDAPEGYEIELIQMARSHASPRPKI
jgi:lactoylglutathione lyase